MMGTAPLGPRAAPARDGPGRRIWARSMVIGLSWFVIAILALLVFHRIESRVVPDHGLLDLAGYQRTLVQGVARAAQRLEAGDDPVAEARLREFADWMQRAEDRLERPGPGDSEAGRALHALYFGPPAALALRLRAFADLALTQADAHGRTPEGLARLRHEADGDLTDLLSRAVALRIAEQAVWEERFQTYELLLIVGLFGILFALSHVAMRPMLARADHFLDQVIEERRRGETERARYRVLADQASFATVLINAAGDIERANAVFRAWFTRDGPASTVEGVLGVEVAAWVRERLLSGERWDLKPLQITLAGEAGAIRAEIRMIAIPDPGDQAWLVIEDVGPRLDEQARLANLTALHAAILNSAANTVIATDLDMTITTFNPAAERKLGYSAAELIGKRRPYAFHLPAEIGARAQELAALLERPIPESEVLVLLPRIHGSETREWTYVRKDGSTFPVLLSIVQLIGPDETLIGWVAIGTDITEQREREQRLRILESAVVNANDAITVSEPGPLTPPGPRFVFVNRAYEHLTGQAAADLVGARSPFYLDPGNWPEVERLRAEIEAGRAARGRMRSLDRNGKPYWTDIGVVPLFDAQGQRTQIVTIQRDVTREIDLIQALREGRERLALFVDFAPAAIAMLDRDLRFIRVSRRWRDDFPGDKGDPIGRRFFDVNPEWGGRWVDVLERALSGVVQRGERERFERTDGKIDWTRWEVRPWYGPNDEVGGVILFSELITTEVEAQIALREHRARLEAILANMVDAVVTMSPSGKIESVNPAGERMFGFRDWTLVGRHVSLIVPNAAAGLALPDGRIEIAPPILEQTREAVARHRDGLLFPIEWALSETDVAGARMYVAIIRDITERKRTERIKSEFISTVSHELRTPLTSILGALGLVLGGAAGVVAPEQTRLLEIAKNNGERLVRLVNDMLDVERIEAGRFDYDVAVVGLLGFLDQAVDANETYARQHGITIERAFGARDAKVMADAVRLGQVVANLLSNAIKFSHPGGVVTVALEIVGDFAHLSIIDRGRGIPPEFQDRIFERFAQADASDSRDKGGTGLGLNISKSIVEQCGGTIHVVSEYGKGSTFTARLPILREPDAGLASAAPGRRILICEDDRALAEILRQHLGEHGFAADLVQDLAGARRALSDGDYSAIVLDLSLPDGDARDFLAENAGLPPVIVVSGRADVAPLARHPGVVEALRKPVDPADLIGSVIAAALPASQGARLLHVEDDARLRALVRAGLGGEAMIVAAGSLAEAREHLATASFDLIVLDLGLPDGDGLDLLADLAGLAGAPPVVVFSAREDAGAASQLIAARIAKSADGVERLVAAVRSALDRRPNAAASSPAWGGGATAIGTVGAAGP